jgi:hypothetical protein
MAIQGSPGCARVLWIASWSSALLLLVFAGI